jgi:hypothetical protein
MEAHPSQKGGFQIKDKQIKYSIPKKVVLCGECRPTSLEDPSTFFSEVKISAENLFYLAKWIPEMHIPDEVYYYDYPVSEHLTLKTKLNQIAKYLTRLQVSVGSLPASIGQLTALVSLELHDSTIPEFPSTIGQLTALESLELHGSTIPEFPSTIGNLTSLHTLNLTGSSVSSLPDEIGKLRNLRHLYLSETKLTALPESIGNLTKLETLDLSFSQIETLPESIGNITSLTSLKLFATPLIRLPDSICNLYSLKHLNFIETAITALPEDFFSLLSHSLEELYFGDKDFFDSNKHNKYVERREEELKARYPGEEVDDTDEWKEIHAELYSIEDYLPFIPNRLQYPKIFKGGLELDFQLSRLNRLPDKIWKVPNLRCINFPHEDISCIPPGFVKLLMQPHFTHFFRGYHYRYSSSDNMIRRNEEGKLVMLKLFRLAYRLEGTSLPENIDELEDLEVLDLSQSNIISLPDSICLLPKLKELKLDYTPLGQRLALVRVGWKRYYGLPLAQIIKDVVNCTEQLPDVAYERIVYDCPTNDLHFLRDNLPSDHPLHQLLAKRYQLELGNQEKMIL